MEFCADVMHAGSQAYYPGGRNNVMRKDPNHPAPVFARPSWIKLQSMDLGKK